MNSVAALIRPRLWSFRNRRKAQTGTRWRALFLVIGLSFWLGAFWLTHRVLVYFRGVEDIGDILSAKLMAMVLLVFFSLLIFSGILTNLSKLYLSRDLPLVHAMPIAPFKIFTARWLESIADSSWMVLVYALPVFLAYGWSYQCGLLYYLNIALVLPPLCVLAGGLSCLTVMAAVLILPANRLRNIFVLLGLIAVIVLYVTFRLLRPERLVNPEAFSSVMVYINALQAPTAAWLPSTWASNSLLAALHGEVAAALRHLTILGSASILMAALLIELASWWYFPGYSKSQLSVGRPMQPGKQRLERVFAFLPGPTRALLIKELKTFWRDQTQWSQLLLLGSLIAIYLYNFSALPLDQSPIQAVYLQNLFSFLNMALAGFVLAAITARFSFPSVSTEGTAIWIIQSAPIALGTFLKIKLAIYLLPLMVLTQILIVATNLLLHVSPFMMALSVVTLLLITPGVVALGIGLGAAYPDFTSENPAQAVTGFGGLLFMLFSALYVGGVTFLEAGPIYHVFRAHYYHHSVPVEIWFWGLAVALVVIIASIVAVIWPMRFGLRRLKERLQAVEQGPVQTTRQPLGDH